MIIKLSWRRDPFPKDFLPLLLLFPSLRLLCPQHLCPYPSSPIFICFSPQVQKIQFHTHLLSADPMPGTVGGQESYSRKQVWSLLTRSKSTGGDRQTQMQIAVTPSQELHTHNRGMNKALWMMTSTKGTLHIHAAFYLGLKEGVGFQPSQRM